MTSQWETLLDFYILQALLEGQAHKFSMKYMEYIRDFWGNKIPEVSSIKIDLDPQSTPEAPKYKIFVILSKSPTGKETNFGEMLHEYILSDLADMNISALTVSVQFADKLA